MKLVEGRHYVNADGVKVGAVKIWDKAVPHCFESKDHLGAKERGIIYRVDGSSAYNSPLVKEVAAPGFKVEAGKFYEIADGRTIGPMIEDSMGSKPAFYCDGFYIVFKSGTTAKVLQYWHENGDVIEPIDGEEFLNIVREVAEPAIETGKDGLTLTISADMSQVQTIIDAAAADFEARAAYVLEQVADKDSQIAAAKDAFNIACADIEKLKEGLATAKSSNEDLRKIVKRCRDLALAQHHRIDSLNSLLDGKNVAIEKMGANAAAYAEKLTDERDTMHIRALNAEALAHNLDTFCDETIRYAEKLERERVRGDNRLRKTRGLLRAARYQNEQKELALGALRAQLAKAKKANLSNSLLALSITLFGAFIGAGIGYAFG